MDRQIVNDAVQTQESPLKNKGLKLIGLVLGEILLLVLFFSLGFFVSSLKQGLPPKRQAAPSPTPTSIPEATTAPVVIEGMEWEAYDGPGYKFKYPKGWHVYVSFGAEYDPQEEINTTNIIISSVPIFAGPGMEGKAVLVRDQSRNPNSTKPDLNFEEFLEDARKSWKKNLRETSFENDGLKFIRFEGERMWMGDYQKMVTYYFNYNEAVGGSNKIIKHVGTIEILGCQDLTSQECKVKDEIIKSLRRILG